MIDGPAATRLRVALVSTCALATPPRGYGGTELVVSELAKGLVARGHEVTVYATADSSPAGELRSFFNQAVWPPDELAEQRHAALSLRDARDGGFDVVHVHHASAIPFHFAVNAPCVATVHHDRAERFERHYQAFPEVSFVAISERQATLSKTVRFAAIVHHGLDPDRYPEGDGAGRYAAFLGRFCEEKAPHVAIDVAIAAGIPIRLGGSAHEVDEAQAYFGTHMRGRLAGPSGRVEWLGELGHDGKLDLLRGACALLFPIQWEEPFGLVMIESMLVGTPVIAFARGSVPEVVEDGVTGFVVETPGDMVERLRGIGAFDRARCRARARERWSHLRMADDYAALYARLRGRTHGGRGRHGATIEAA